MERESVTEVEVEVDTSTELNVGARVQVKLCAGDEVVTAEVLNVMPAWGGFPTRTIFRFWVPKTPEKHGYCSWAYADTRKELCL